MSFLGFYYNILSHFLFTLAMSRDLDEKLTPQTKIGRLVVFSTELAKSASVSTLVPYWHCFLGCLNTSFNCNIPEHIQLSINSKIFSLRCLTILGNVARTRRQTTLWDAQQPIQSTSLKSLTRRIAFASSRTDFNQISLSRFTGHLFSSFRTQE